MEEFKSSIPFNFDEELASSFVDDSCDILAICLKEIHPEFNIHSVSLFDNKAQKYENYHYCVGCYIHGEYVYIDIDGIWKERDLINYWNKNSLNPKINKSTFCITNNLPDLSDATPDMNIIQNARNFAFTILQYLRTL